MVQKPALAVDALLGGQLVAERHAEAEAEAASSSVGCQLVAECQAEAEAWAASYSEFHFSCVEYSLLFQSFQLFAGERRQLLADHSVHCGIRGGESCNGQAASTVKNTLESWQWSLRATRCVSQGWTLRW